MRGKMEGVKDGNAYMLGATPLFLKITFLSPTPGIWRKLFKKKARILTLKAFSGYTYPSGVGIIVILHTTNYIFGKDNGGKALYFTNSAKSANFSNHLCLPPGISGKGFRERARKLSFLLTPPLSWLHGMGTIGKRHITIYIFIIMYFGFTIYMWWYLWFTHMVILNIKEEDLI